MPASYLTTAQATARLARYSIESSPPVAYLEVASDDLDLKGPFVGEPVEEVQYRAFPRTPAIRDDVAGTVPNNILDWVALRAYQLTEDDDAPALVEKVDKLAAEYSRGKKSTQARLMKNLLRLYRDTSDIRIV